MAFLKLRSVTCNSFNGGRIQLQIGPEILLPYIQIAVPNELLPKTVDFSDQGLMVEFIGTVAIELFDENLLVITGNSVVSSEGIGDVIVSSEDRTLIYENTFCSGNYTVTYEIDNNFTGTVLALITTVGEAVVAIVVAITVFLRNLSILALRPFTRFFSDRNNPNNRNNRPD